MSERGQSSYERHSGLRQGLGRNLLDDASLSFDLHSEEGLAVFDRANIMLRKNSFQDFEY